LGSGGIKTNRGSCTLHYVILTVNVYHTRLKHIFLVVPAVFFQFENFYQIGKRCDVMTKTVKNFQFGHAFLFFIFRSDPVEVEEKENFLDTPDSQEFSRLFRYQKIL
jgi:hypothetical protein